MYTRNALDLLHLLNDLDADFLPLSLLEFFRCFTQSLHNLVGDDYAHEVMLETAKILGAGISNVINTLNPEVVVIVGGVTRAGDHLFVPLRSEVRRRAFTSAVDACRIVPGELPETAGAIGAAGIFMSQAGLDGGPPADG